MWRASYAALGVGLTTGGKEVGRIGGEVRVERGPAREKLVPVVTVPALTGALVW